MRFPLQGSKFPKPDTYNFSSLLEIKHQLMMEASDPMFPPPFTVPVEWVRPWLIYKLDDWFCRFQQCKGVSSHKTCVQPLHSSWSGRKHPQQVNMMKWPSNACQVVLIVSCITQEIPTSLPHDYSIQIHKIVMNVLFSMKNPNFLLVQSKCQILSMIAACNVCQNHLTLLITKFCFRWLNSTVFRKKL